MNGQLDPRRNAAIMRLVSQGLNGTVIGRRYGLSRERIRQIAKKYGVLSLRQPPKHSKVCPQCGGPRTNYTGVCRDCYHANTWTIKICPGCGESRPIQHSQLAALKSHFCRACYFKAHWETRPCAWCGELITRRRSGFRYGVALHPNTDPRHCLSKWRTKQKRSLVLQGDDGEPEPPVVKVVRKLRVLP